MGDDSTQPKPNTRSYTQLVSRCVELLKALLGPRSEQLEATLFGNSRSDAIANEKACEHSDPGTPGKASENLSTALTH